MGCARLGQPDQKIVAGTLAELVDVDFGAPLHCLVICGELHPCEVELLEFFKTAAREPRRVVEEEGDGSGSSSEEEDEDGGQ